MIPWGSREEGGELLGRRNPRGCPSLDPNQDDDHVFKNLIMIVFDLSDLESLILTLNFEIKFV